jgi:hypothetical protein
MATMVRRRSRLDRNSARRDHRHVGRVLDGRGGADALR